MTEVPRGDARTAALQARECRHRRRARLPRTVPRRDQPGVPVAAEAAARAGRDRAHRHLRAHRRRGRVRRPGGVAQRGALHRQAVLARAARARPAGRGEPVRRRRRVRRTPARVHPRRPDPVHDHRVRARPARPARPPHPQRPAGALRRAPHVDGRRPRRRRAGGAHRARARPRLAAARTTRPLRRAAAPDRRRRCRPRGARAAARRRAGGAARAPRVRVVRQAPAAVARGARDQQHAAVDRRRHLPGGAVQRLVPRHRDRRPQPGRRAALRPPARRRGRDGPRPRFGAHAVARPGRDRAGARGAALVRRGGRDDVGPPRGGAPVPQARGKEERAGRGCPADWSWIVPPISGALTPVFHRYYDEPDPTIRPAYLPPADTLRGHPRR